MRGDPSVTVTCDSCGDDEEVRLTPLAGNGFDMRGVNGQLKHLGWSRQGDNDYCADCTEGRGENED